MHIVFEINRTLILNSEIYNRTLLQKTLTYQGTAVTVCVSVSDYYKNENARMFPVLCRPAALLKSRHFSARFGTEPINPAVYLLAQLHISTSIYSLLVFSFR